LAQVNDAGPSRTAGAATGYDAAAAGSNASRRMNGAIPEPLSEASGEPDPMADPQSELQPEVQPSFD
jgi:hypothetical protein